MSQTFSSLWTIVSSPWCSLACSRIPAISAFVFTWLSSPCVSPLLSHKDTCHWVWAPSQIQDDCMLRSLNKFHLQRHFSQMRSHVQLLGRCIFGGGTQLKALYAPQSCCVLGEPTQTKRGGSPQTKRDSGLGNACSH